MFIKNLGITFLGFCFGYLLFPFLACQACNIPVFRYALERWPADTFEVVVFHRGKFTPKAKTVVDMLEKGSFSGRADGNYEVKVVDLDSEMESSIRELWQAQHDVKLPWMVVRYPIRSGIKEGAWASQLTMGAAKALLDSPLRREVTKRILRGDAAVWILLESGNHQKDNKAAALLESQLKEMEKTLKLPLLADTYFDEGADDGGDEEKGVVFSILRLSRNDSREQPLISMLLNSESDLRTFSEPIAFPIFGRGRVLYALVGKGINEENIAETCSFLVGPCSCQAKEMNPGTDLLFCVDWDRAIFGEWDEDEGPPLPTEVRDLTPVSAAVSNRVQSLPETDVATDKFETTLLRNTLLVLAAGLSIVVIAAVIILKRSRRLHH